MAARQLVRSPGLVVSTGTGRMTAGQPDLLVRPAAITAKNPVVFYHGFNDTSLLLWGRNWFRRYARAFTQQSFSMVAPSTSNGYGNATVVARGASAAAYHVANLSGTGKRVNVGVSMGCSGALKDAWSNPTQVACVILVLCVTDLQMLRVQQQADVGSDILGIDAAWGVTWPAALPANASPVDNVAGLVGMPIQIWYATDDSFSTNTPAFAAAVGAELHSLGALGHTDAAQEAVDLAAMMTFVNAHLT